MSISISRFQTKILNATPDLEKYKLYKAALEWDVVEPIVIDSKADVQSEKKWRDLVEPYHHQITNLITFCRRLPVTLLSDDVGLGKTISAGLIASELISRNRISKILIICPKILRAQWKEELETKFNIPSVVVKSGEQFIKECRAKKKGAIIATYTTGSLHLDKIQQGDFDMLILDEAHKLRNLYGVIETPQVAKNFSKALSERLFRYVLMLTATPIQNRLWDMYSLVDLLTVARGHTNPFGSPEIFARRFIGDSRTQARRLKPEMTNEFRSIVYGYMSRVRREDAKLYFPDRVVQIHLVEPTPEELNLVKTTANSITKLAIFLQITLLKTLISSPEALEKVLDGMVLKGTIQLAIAYEIKLAIRPIQLSTKLKGLFELVKKLKSEQPSTWRMVVFTTYKETQTTIKCFLESHGISCGLINGDSNSRNQESIERFKKDEPEINVLISTEAGSEGVNLQVANVLVNYDLPWNPMVVEQRIGRVQRLSSKHANVCIFNIILKGTFEEYIVGRLMEKLQMASHAVGDIEALLEATGITEEEGSGSFEYKIRKLVMDSLAGKDVERAIKLSEQSIADAKAKLESEENNINSMLGGSIEQLDYGPTSPKLSKTPKSMDYQTLVLQAYKNLGDEVEPIEDERYIIRSENTLKTICFDSNKDGILYAPGSPDFENLVNKLTSSGLHYVKDEEHDALSKSENIAREWILNFGANFDKLELQKVSRGFNGMATTRVRATVAHDSYERIVEIECKPTEHFATYPGKGGMESVQGFIDNPAHVGISSNTLSDTASKDADILEFCRFYLERREREMNAAGEDFAKRKKLEDEFTPRLEISLVGLAGNVQRELEVKVTYNFEQNASYQSILTVTPYSGKIVTPKMANCAKTDSIVPYDCLHKCDISNQLVLKHLLTKSEISNRLALPEHTVQCSLSGKLVLSDEAEKSEISGNLVSKSLLKISSLSGKKAEPKFFTTCEFSNTEVLENEVKISQISGKRYRSDQELSSSISGKLGHKREFILCSETNQPLLESEAEKCEITGKIVKPGILKKCELTGKKVMPTELEKSDISGNLVLKSLLKTSSLSGKKAEGKFFTICEFSNSEVLDNETKVSQISGKKYRFDEELSSVVSGKNGHKKEFIFCGETNQPLLESEAEKCEITGKIVKPGILERCDVTEMKVMPTELEKSAISSKKALKKFLVSSNLSEARILESEAVRSTMGRFCTPHEAKLCYWSEEKYHPEDLKNCDLTGLAIHSKYLTTGLPPRLENLFNLLVGTNNKTDQTEKWEEIANKLTPILDKGNCKIKAAELSPTANCLAIFIEAKSWIGFKTRHIGLLYSLKENNMIGRAAIGKLEAKNWIALKN